MWHGVVRMLYERTSRHGSAHPHLVERTDRGMTSSRVPWPVSFAVSAIHPFAVELMTGVVIAHLRFLRSKIPCASPI